MTFPLFISITLEERSTKGKQFNAPPSKLLSTSEKSDSKTNNEDEFPIEKPADSNVDSNTKITWLSHTILGEQKRDTFYTR
jgi:hypothetical protein